MRLKDYVAMLGWRPKPRVYGHAIDEYELQKEGRVQYARWLHPKVRTRPVQQAQVDALRAFLSPGDVAIDIGAHEGDTALPMALAVGPTGAVLALEPNPYVYPVLARNAMLNPGRTRIIALAIAAAPEDGDIEFEYSDAGFCNGGRHAGISKWRHGHAFRLTVPGRNLERYLEAEHPMLIPRIRYIKVDAEGFDHAVLASIEGLLRRQRPYLRAEVLRHVSAEERRAFFDYLERLGYRLCRMTSETQYDGPALEESDLMIDRTFDIFGVPDRC